jgi:protocatechuate 3,4-dioxygenase, beta subunit
VSVIGYRRDDEEVDPPYLYPDYVATRTRAPRRPLVPLPHTLSEITGPVYGHETLVAREEDGALRFDVHLQGDGETAFFAV